MLTPNRIHIVLYLVLQITCIACIDPYEADVEQGEIRLVVQGEISSAPGPYQVILSYSANYSSLIDGISTYISGAYVCIHDDLGNCAELFENDRGNYYTDDPNFMGVIGRSYHLEVILPDGKRYLSVPELMLKPPEISRVYAEYHTETDLDPEGFYVYIEVDDPADQVNFYKWETVSWYLYSWDPCWYRLPDFSPFNIESDKNVNGNKIERKLVKRVPYNGRTPYVVTTYQQALSESAYNFLKNLNEQIKISGSIFDPPPTFIRGNIMNDQDPDEIVLGYFIAAGATEIEIAVDRSIPENAPSYYAPILDPPLYCGDPCDYLCVAYAGGTCGLPPCPPECNDLPNITYQPPEAWPLVEEICDE